MKVTKFIPGYEGIYSITATGDIISHGPKSNHVNDIVLKTGYDKDGYRKITLKHNKKQKTFRVCRLVAEAFCPNPSDKKFVNHIDENKANDNATNLEWVTAYENYIHSNPSGIHKVAALNFNGDLVATYSSLMEAAREKGINQGNITNCIKGRCKSVGGLIWVRL